jgi:hypothetical protein
VGPTAPRVVRHVALLVLLLTALVVASLPGTTTAASLPGSPRLIDVARPDPPVTPVLIEDNAAPAAQSVPAPAPGAEQSPDAQRPLPPSYFADSQIVALYGHPGVPAMGELGAHSPEEDARLVQDLAAQYDALNGPRGVLPAFHLIVDVAQAHPGADGTYLAQMSLEDIQPYVDVARQDGILLFLDLQIGWADPLQEVERLEPLLELPFVHVALDPEFSTRSLDVAPGQRIGTLDAAAVNQVEDYLAGIASDHDLPPKILVLHQFMESMLTHTADIEHVPGVEVTVDMDGFGPPSPKIAEYRDYALSGYAQRAAIKLFYRWDAPLMTPQDVLDLPQAPDYVIYQ